jgi:hypothetical protein
MSTYMHRILRFEAGRGVGYSEIKIAKLTTFLTGYFQSYRWVESREVFEIMKNLQIRDNSEALIKLRNLAKEDKPLVVHVRLGDYKSETTFGIPDRDYYWRAIHNLWETGRYNKIWVFTNEQELASDYLPNCLSEYFFWVDEVENSSAKTLEAMRLGYGYIIGNSTFSWWAAYISQSESPLVIAPCPWFKIQAEPKDIVPTTWRRLQAWG